MEICTHMNEAREENIKDFSNTIFNNMKKRGQNMNILFTLKNEYSGHHCIVFVL